METEAETVAETETEKRWMPKQRTRQRRVVAKTVPTRRKSDSPVSTSLRGSGASEIPTVGRFRRTGDEPDPTHATAEL